MAEAAAGSGTHALETAATRGLPTASALHGQGSQNRAGMLRSLGARSLADRPGIPHHHGIHSSGDQCNPEHRNNLSIHTPVVGRADIHWRDSRKEDRRNPDTRRRGNRNKCRAGMVFAREPGRPRSPEHSTREAISASFRRRDKGGALF